VNQIAQTRNLSDPLTLEFFKPRVVKKLNNPTFVIITRYKEA
jgi:hypothetical protein